jgi:tetratricopeptide (TPR) repeat protein
MNPPAHSRRTLWICLALAAVTLAAYAPALRCDFLTFDDQAYVTENRHVMTGLTWQSIAWAFRNVTAGNWHPLTMLSHILDCQIYGLRPWGHHLTNVLLHVANTVILFLLLARMTAALWRPACVAALFALHPAHVESVAWVAERKDVLCAFFWLLAILAYARDAEGQKRGIYYAGALLFFLLALLAKPMAVTLPCVLLLLDFWPLRRMASTSWRHLVAEKLPFFALTALWCPITIWAQRQGHSMASVRELPMAERIGHALISYLNYIRVLAFPRHLAVYYPYPNHEPVALAVVAGAVLALVTGLAVAAVGRRPYLLVGWLWFLGMLVPVIGLVQAGGQGWADRYLYLPSIGLFVIVVWAGAEAAARFPAVKYFAPAALAALAVATVVELRYWKDTRTLFSRAMEVTQDNYMAMTLVGSMEADRGDLDGAIKLYRDALRCLPNYPEGHFFYARALERKGQTAPAIAEYTKALQLRPAFDQAHLMLGLLLARQKNYDEAVAHFQAALKSNSDSASAQNDWGRVLQTQGRWQESIGHYQEALRLDPALAEAHNNLGIDYLQTGRLADGAGELRMALKLNPGNVETRFNLAQALNQQRQWADAAQLLKPLALAQPANPNSQYQYGLALENLGQTRDAMSHYAAALLQNPDFPDALNALAWIIATDPRPELRNGSQAVELARRACDLTAHQQPAMLLTLAAAYAETGRWSEALAAVKQGEALAASKGDADLEDRASRLRQALAAGQPFRSQSIMDNAGAPAQHH